MIEVHAERCGQFELRGRPADFGTCDGRLRLCAEASYVVLPAPSGAAKASFGRALTVSTGSGEGSLRFGNSVGLTEIGGRPVQVDSRRLDAPAAERMRDEVIERIGGIPVQASEPVGSTYERRRSNAIEADYLTFALVRDAMRARGPHDLAAAVERILARPHERLQTEQRAVPTWQIGRLDPGVLMQLMASSGPRLEVSAASKLAAVPVVRALRGSLPEKVSLRHARPATDTRENRFVVMVLEHVSLRMYEVATQARGNGSPVVARQAGELAGACERWRLHPALADLEPLHAFPVSSTVLRGRAGYRQLLAFWIDILARAALVPPSAARRIVEVRDAATTYEYWCFFAVCRAVEASLRRHSSHRPKRTWQGPGLTSDFVAAFGGGEVEVHFNRRFSQADDFRSYSLPLRPDILMQLPGGERHVFDAKFAFEPGRIRGRR